MPTTAHGKAVLTAIVTFTVGLIAALTLCSLAVRAGVLYTRADKQAATDFAIPLVSAGLAWGIMRLDDRRNNNPKRFFVPILYTGLIVRAGVFYMDLHDRPKPENDWKKYETLARRLAEEGRYYDFRAPNGLELRSFRPPGLPLILAGVHTVLPPELAPVVTMHTISLALLVVGYKLTSLSPSLPSLLLCLYLAVSPSVLALTRITNPHLPLAVVLLLVLYCSIKWRQDLIVSVLLGVLSGVASLIRAEASILPLFLAFVHFLAVIKDRKKASYRKALLHVAPILAAWVLTIGPWIYRNWVVQRGFMFISSNGGWVMYSANVIENPKRGGGYNGVKREAFDACKSCGEVELERHLRWQALKYIWDHPLLYITSIPFRVSGLMRMQSWSVHYMFGHMKTQVPKLARECAVRSSEGLLWVLYWLCLLIGWRRKKVWQPVTGLLAFYCVMIVAFALIFESLDRNHFPYILLPIAILSLGGREAVGSSVAGAVEAGIGGRDGGSGVVYV